MIELLIQANYQVAFQFIPLIAYEFDCEIEGKISKMISLCDFDDFVTTAILVTFICEREVEYIIKIVLQELKIDRIAKSQLKLAIKIDPEK